jgi:prevent-host-death family protein
LETLARTSSRSSKVNDDRTPIEITSRHGDAVLLSRADYEALEETAHLLRVRPTPGG